MSEDKIQVEVTREVSDGCQVRITHHIEGAHAGRRVSDVLHGILKIVDEEKKARESVPFWDLDKDEPEIEDEGFVDSSIRVFDFDENEG